MEIRYTECVKGKYGRKQVSQYKAGTCYDKSERIASCNLEITR